MPAAHRIPQRPREVAEPGQLGPGWADSAVLTSGHWHGHECVGQAGRQRWASGATAGDSPVLPLPLPRLCLGHPLPRSACLCSDLGMGQAPLLRFGGGTLGQPFCCLQNGDTDLSLKASQHAEGCVRFLASIRDSVNAQWVRGR